MAPEERVKQYLALWLQLGKQVVCSHDDRLLGTRRTIDGEAYSAEFEQLWRQILEKPQMYHLAGTVCSMKDLLSGHWSLLPCARCSLLYPINDSYLEAGPCPCQDLASWPDDGPPPRGPVCVQDYLDQIRLRLSRQKLIPTPPSEETTGGEARESDTCSLHGGGLHGGRSEHSLP